MARIIALTNQKGGCAKTTTAVNLASGLANKGKRVLLIDMDPQANATSVFIDLSDPPKTIYDVLFNKVSPKEVIVKTKIENLFLLPSGIELSAADLKLSDIIGREKILLHSTKGILDNYDYVIIDTPPSLGLLTVNALTTAKEVMIPISASYFAMKGVNLLQDTINLIRKNLDHPKLKVSGAICTIFDPVTNVSRDTLKLLKDHFKNLLMKTIIRKNIKLEEAHSAGKSIFEYAPNSAGAEDYLELTKEVIKNG